jgi:hypothetical protein
LDADAAGQEALIGKGRDWPLASLLGPMTRVVSWSNHQDDQKEA